MDAFTTSYIATALWSTNDNSNESGGDPLDKNYSADDIAPDTLAKMIDDCRRFQAENAAALAERDDSNGGHDFWLTRNRHGAGFWDGDWPEPFATKLTDAAHEFGEFDLYIGDDGKVHGSPL